MSEFTEKLRSSELVSHAWGEIDRDQANAGLLIDVIKSEFKDWKPPKQLVELPQIIADWIELIKQRNRNVLTLLDSDDMPNDVYDWLFIKEDDENINLILLAWIDGYTVEKEKKYILKHIDLSKSSSDDSLYLTHGFYKALEHIRYSKDVDMSRFKQCHFTQTEIDKLNVGSYEQKEVEPCKTQKLS